MPNLPTSPKRTRLYHSYLVRLWQEDIQTPWRAVAQSVQTGEAIHFADLPALFAFLQAQTQYNAEDDNSNASVGQENDCG